MSRRYFVIMKAYLRLLFGVIIACPITIVCGVFYVLPLWSMGWLTFHSVVRSKNESSPLGVAAVFHLSNRQLPKWFVGIWKEWHGHCVGSIVVMHDRPGTTSHDINSLNHELHHVHQCHTFGILQPIFYTMSSLTAALSGEGAYSGNHYEAAARRASNQVVDPESFLKGFALGKEKVRNVSQ